MNWFVVLLLYIVTSPGILVTIPPIGKKIVMSGRTHLVAAAFHAVLFLTLVMYYKTYSTAPKVQEGFLSKSCQQAIAMKRELEADYTKYNCDSVNASLWSPMCSTIKKDIVKVNKVLVENNIPVPPAPAPALAPAPSPSPAGLFVSPSFAPSSMVSPSLAPAPSFSPVPTSSPASASGPGSIAPAFAPAPAPSTAPAPAPSTAPAPAPAFAPAPAPSSLTDIGTPAYAPAPAPAPAPSPAGVCTYECVPTFNKDANGMPTAWAAPRDQPFTVNQQNEWRYVEDPGNSVATAKLLFAKITVLNPLTQPYSINNINNKWYILLQKPGNLTIPGLTAIYPTVSNDMTTTLIQMIGECKASPACSPSPVTQGFRGWF